MALSKIWVHAEIGGDKPSTATLELVSKARELADTVEAFYAGDNAAAVAEERGRYGCSKLYTVDTGDSLQGVPVSSAIAKEIQGGNAPDLIMFAFTYDGRDVMSRLSVALDRPVITGGDAVEVSGDDVVVNKSIFGG